MTVLKRWTWAAGLAAAAACGLAGPGCFWDPRSPAEHRESANNLKQFAIAVQNFQSTWGKLPPAGGEAGFGLGQGYSWRVHLLPYLEQINVYNQLIGRGGNQPGGAGSWNDPQLLGTKILLYQPKFARPPMESGTFYRVFVGPGTAFDPQDPAGQAIGNKLMIVEAGDAVPWPKPEELEYSPDRPLPPLGGMFSDGFHGVYGDGTVRFFPKNTDEKTLREAITGTYQGERPGR
jgi:hypothetical protein